MLGPLVPLLGPAAPGDLTYARSGYVASSGLILDLHAITFDDPPVGAAALVRWLAERGCIGMSYEVTPYPAFDPSELGEDPG